MLTRFTNEITKNHLCTKVDRILLAISGGADSMVMLNLFHSGGYLIGVAHCNFQLRDKESDEDENFVKDWCDQRQVPFHSKRFDTKNYAAETGVSIQMAARELRYTWFNELLDNENYDLLATAHHLNDNLETTLLNFIRGTGIKGLIGIPQISNKIIRPLLGLTKEELVSYARSNKIKWREDESNDSDDYDRNFLRHQVIPKLKELNPSLEDGFKRTNQRLLGAEALFQLGIDQLKDEFVLKDGNSIKIGKAFLTVTRYPVAVAWELIKDYGFNFSQCAEAVVVSEGISGKKFLSADYQLVIDRDTWIISPHAGKLIDVIIDSQEKKVSFGNMELSIEKGRYESLSSNLSVAMLDADEVKFPLTWRKWEKGDFFSPLGMDNRKKLSDFFIDNKLSLVDKEEATVIEANGEIVWVVGHRISNRYKVTEQTKDVLRLTVSIQL